MNFRKNTHQLSGHSQPSITTNIAEKCATVAIGLGTSIEPRSTNLSYAIRKLITTVFTKSVPTKMSSWYHSRACVPWGSKDLRPTEYINCMMTGSTFLYPDELLSILKEIEIFLGRDLHAPRWSPRPIDLDIIVYNNEPFENLELTIPHPRAIDRIWVLAPLHEVWPTAFVHHTRPVPTQILATGVLPMPTESEHTALSSVHHCSYEGTDIDVTTMLEYYAGETVFEKIVPADIVVKEYLLTGCFV